ncbi:MAG: tail fiber domain-containing protein [Symploca sp. SIO2G7]|nr:tail fiber domain-containing protein [Symploca sp. SIO2G7]
MTLFTRDISILKKFDKHAPAEQILYTPGITDPKTATPGVYYSGKVEQLILISELEHYNTLVFWIEDVEGIRHQLNNELIVRSSAKPINLICLVFGEQSIKIAPNNKLGITLLFPNNFVKTQKNTDDFITIFGFACEQAEQFDETSNANALAIVGKPDGIAPLDNDGVVPREHLPDWQEYDELVYAIAGKQKAGSYALDPHEHSQYQGAGNYALDPHEHSQYQRAGNYALDSHEHTIESIFGRNVISQQDPVPFGDIQINQVSPKWGGIRFHQPNNPLSKDWILMINHDDAYASYQGIYSPDVGWIFYIPPDKKIRGYGFVTVSDEREKKNIRPFSDVLDKIMQVIPVLFSWKTNNDEDYGFTAQNVRPIFPQAVEEELIDPTKPKLGNRLVLEDKQLTSILWQGLKEVITELRELRKLIDRE